METVASSSTMDRNIATDITSTSNLVIPSNSISTTRSTFAHVRLLRRSSFFSHNHVFSLKEDFTQLLVQLDQEIHDEEIRRQNIRTNLHSIQRLKDQLMEQRPTTIHGHQTWTLQVSGARMKMKRERREGHGHD